MGYEDESLDIYQQVADVRLRDVRHMEGDVLFRALVAAEKVGDFAVMFMVRAELTRRDVADA